MIMLHTGWINFRMRAMLASFAAYNLWLDWRLYAPHLGRCFLDYEPGIHYPQLQMQAGVTGINALRVYSVTKQAKDHDPTGEFIKAWVPELRNVPVKYIHEPWMMPQHVQSTVGVLVVPYPALPGTSHGSLSTTGSSPNPSSSSPTNLYYPQPIVDEVQTARMAKERMGAVIRTIEAESQAVFKKHGSRMGPRKSGNRSKGDANKESTSQPASGASKVRRIDDAFKAASSSSGFLSSPPTTGSSSIFSQGHMITTPSTSSSSSRLTGDRESRSKPSKSDLHRFFLSSPKPPQINTSKEVIILTSDDDEDEDDINFEPYTHSSSSSQQAYTNNNDVISLSDADSVNDDAVDLPHRTGPYSVPAESTVTWTCNICTYINRYIMTNGLCEICGSCYGMT